VGVDVALVPLEGRFILGQLSQSRSAWLEAEEKSPYRKYSHTICAPKGTLRQRKRSIHGVSNSVLSYTPSHRLHDHLFERPADAAEPIESAIRVIEALLPFNGNERMKKKVLSNCRWQIAHAEGRNKY
jgi:hypothetical protein